MEALARALARYRWAARSRRLYWALGGGVVLLVLGGALARQARLAHEALARAEAAERAAARADAETKKTRDARAQRATSRSATTAARTRQIYKELDVLLSAKDRVESDLEETRRKAETYRGHARDRGRDRAEGAAAGTPAPAPAPLSLSPLFPTTKPGPLVVPR